MLAFDLQVNGESIGKFYATNQERRPIGPDPVSTYDVTIINSEGEQKKFAIEHRYKDGAWALVALALMEYDSLS